MLRASVWIVAGKSMCSESRVNKGCSNVIEISKSPCCRAI